MTASWIINGKTIDSAKDLINACLKNAKLPSFAKVRWQNSELHVLIEQGGKSELCLGLKQLANDVQLFEIKRNISFLHKPFTGTVEKMLEKLINEAGFTRQG